MSTAVPETSEVSSYLREEPQIEEMKLLCYKIVSLGSREAFTSRLKETA